MHLDEEKTLEEVDSVTTNMAGNGRITYSSIGNILYLRKVHFPGVVFPLKKERIQPEIVFKMLPGVLEYHIIVICILYTNQYHIFKQ